MTAPVIFVHLRNDMSGSPRVLKGTIKAFSTAGHRVKLFVGSDGPGILDGVEVERTQFPYRRRRWRASTFVSYIFSQVALYRKMSTSSDIPSDAIVYINTLLPFGAALWGRVHHRRVVFHLHEVSITPVLLRRFLVWVATRTGSLLIYVSHDHRSRLPIGSIPAIVVPNAVDDETLRRGKRASQRPRPHGYFTVLMLCSLREYKGIPEFLALANRLVEASSIRFVLVVSETHDVVDEYFQAVETLPNVMVYAQTTDPAHFYDEASLVVNLSRTDEWIETFGLTLVEAMAFGLPVIAPPVGGPAEIVTDGVEGYLIDSKNLDALSAAVLRLSDDKSLYARMSASAHRRALNYTPSRFAESVRAGVVQNLSPHDHGGSTDFQIDGR